MAAMDDVPYEPPRGRSTGRWLLMSLIALVVVAAMVVGALGGAGVFSEDVPTPSRTPGPRSADRSPDTSLADRLPEDVAWWQLDFAAMGPAGEVRVGTVGLGETARVDLGIGDGLARGAQPNRFAAGPSDGWVVVVGSDGDDSILIAVEAATGHTVELVRSREFIVDAEFVGGDLAFVTADPIDLAPTGVWRVPVPGDGQPARIDGLIGAVPSVRLAAIVEWITDLVVSADGTHLALYRCEHQDCEIRIVDLLGGGSWLHPLDWEARPVGMVGRWVVLNRVCVDVDCHVELFDAETGAGRELPRSDDRMIFDVAITTEPVTVVTHLANAEPAAGQGRAAIEIVDPDTLDLRVQRVALRALDVGQAVAWDVGVELPPGTLLARGTPPGGDPSTDHDYYLVSIATGRAVPIPDLHEAFVQG